VHEVVRRCPLPIEGETAAAAQSWILHTQIAEELVAQARYPVAVCDRSALDNYVYRLLAAGRDESLEALLAGWLPTYDLLVHVPIVALPRPDGFRSTDPGFQQAVEERLARELAERALPVLALDSQGRAGWLDRVELEIWGRMSPAQLLLPAI